MRFTSFIVAGLFAVAANAASSTTAPSATAASVDPAQSSAASAIEACLKACDPSDTNCRAHCIAVPSPDNQNVNQTTSCVAACPQGKGTAADNKAYADCVEGCIGQYYFTNTGTPDLATSSNAGGNGGDSSVTQVPTTITSGGSTITTVVPTTTGGSGSGNGNGNGNGNGESGGPSSTSSSSAGAAAITAFPHVGTVGTGLGLVGLLAGVLAL